MITITKEQAREIIEAADAVITALAGKNEDVHPDNSTKMVQLYDDLNDHYAPPEVVRELARIAMASLEAEPVAWLVKFEQIGHSSNNFTKTYFDKGEKDRWVDLHKKSGFNVDVTPLHSAPPAPTVPEEKCDEDGNTTSEFDHGWNACRAVMLQGSDDNSPVIPDGWVNCKHLLPIGELIHRLEEQTGEKWIYAKDAIPDGYVMVPVEPTEKMVIEGFESEPDEFFSKSEEWEAYQEMSGCEQVAHRAKLCWAAMIAAAPKPEVKL